jgi:hypothetical protein
MCAAPLVCYYPISRSIAYTECWEDSSYSPSILLEKSDIVELGVLARYRHVGEISYSLFGDTKRDDVTELVYRRVAAVKGNVDSVAVWILGPLEPASSGFCIGDTALVYGLRVSAPNLIVLMTSYCSGTVVDSLVAPALLASPNVMHELWIQIPKMPVIVLTDGWKVFDYYRLGYDICYYDDNKSPQCVRPSRYWKEIQNAAK